MFLDAQNVSGQNFDGTAGNGLVPLNNAAKPVLLQQLSIVASPGTFDVTTLEARGPDYGTDPTEKMPIPVSSTLPGAELLESPNVCIPQGWTLVVVTSGLGAGDAARLLVCVEPLGGS